MTEAHGAAATVLHAIMLVSPQRICFHLADKGGIVPLLKILASSVDDDTAMAQSLLVLIAIVSFDELRGIVRRYIAPETITKVLQSKNGFISGTARRLKMVLG